MPRISAALILLLLPACSDKSESDFGAPEEGPWSVKLESIDNGCELDPDEYGDFTDILAMDEDGGGFTLTPDNGDTGYTDPDFRCTLDGQDYTCEPMGEADFTWDWNDSGVDAVVTVAYTFGGTFQSDTVRSFFVRTDMSCTGSQCDAIAQSMEISGFSCTTTHLFSATAD